MSSNTNPQEEFISLLHKPFPYPSGVEVVLNEAPFELQEELHTVLITALGNVSSVPQVLAVIFADRNIKEILWKCLQYCLYDKSGTPLKVTKQLFNDKPEAKQDLYALQVNCLAKNIIPFLPALISMLKTLGTTKIFANQE